MRATLGNPESVGDSFGFSEAVYGETVVVGSHKAEVSFIYDYNSTAKRATLVGPLQASDVSDDVTGDSFGFGFGFQVEIERNAILVSAPFRNSNSTLTDARALYVFTYDLGKQSWVESTVLSVSNGGPSDLFGSSIALYGDRVVAGAYGDSDNGSDSGSVYAFQLSLLSDSSL